MKIFYKKLIIIFLLISLHYLCIPSMSSSFTQCCETRKCNNDDSFSIEYPFRLKGDDQSESCGCRGFELYCDDELGLLLELPNAGNFTVDYIFYYSREIKISDPSGCFPQKLLTVDLSTTPFFRGESTVDYQLYNCSATSRDNLDIYDDVIKCLSGSDYNVISSFTLVSDPNCTFLNYVSVPTDFRKSLSSYSSISVTWDEHECVSCVEPRTPNNNDQGIAWRVVLALLLPISIILIVICCACLPRCMTPSNQPAAARTTDTSAHTNTTSAPTSSGLDQVTIDSYPVVNLGEGGGVIKHDYGMCPICLSEYTLKDTLKMLPHCLHRFHVDCIDVWLQCKPTCPICRTFPSHKLANFLV